MGDSSFISILILLVLFIVLPSVLKFVGQYTLNNKNAGKGRNQDQTEPPDREADLTEYGEEPYRKKDLGSDDTQFDSAKPINPKWF